MSVKTLGWPRDSRLALALALAAGSSVVLADGARAQVVSALEEEIVVTATKRGLENLQDVPLAITAYNAEQLDALNFRDLSSLSYTAPNVQLEDIGTAPGIANFSIRGLGVNSSIPSIDPTVGVFVDGMYMGINYGILTENFDLEGIEVLRGPQGVLFGRNVTGGAVLIRTTAPGDELRVAASASVETGPNYTYHGLVSGPIVAGLLSGKLALYTNDDSGWFTNLADNSQFGAIEQTIVRPALRLTPGEGVDLILRLEHGETDGDGPAGQNHAIFSRDSFDFAINNRGFQESEWDQAILEGNFDVPLGDGVVTAILGWRQYEFAAGTDIDATPGVTPFTVGGNFPIGFHANALTEQEQRSLELRYAGTFGAFELTTGLYYFQQDLLYLEQRMLFNGANITGGGRGDFSTWGGFAAVDWHLNDAFAINMGLRYTHEEKTAEIATLPFNSASIPNRTLTPDFISEDSWNDLSPRVGFQWTPNEDTQLYGFWARGFRSGGYNFRNTDPGVAPGPFDSESQNSVELGLKQDLFEGRLRVNLAAFHNEIDDIQREISTPGALGVTQITTNVGDVTIQGAEIEGQVFLTDDLVLSIMAGYTEGAYDRLIFNLDTTAGIGPSDFALELPRLAPWTYGATIVWDLNLGAWATLSSRLSYNHRDETFFTDNNLGRLNAADMLDANFTLAPSGSSLRVSLYGTNLLDEATFGGDTQLPNAGPFGGDGAGPRPSPTFSALNKGRVVGLELSVAF